MPYEIVRDRFIANFPTTREEDLPYFAEIGLFVFGRWQQIASDHQAGDEIDEVAFDHRWNDCTEDDLAKHKEDARRLVATNSEQWGLVEYTRYWTSRIEPFQTALKIVYWVIKQLVAGFISAIGVILIGLAILKFTPELTKAIRAAVDDVAPADTRPAEASEGVSTGAQQR